LAPKQLQALEAIDRELEAKNAPVLARLHELESKKPRDEHATNGGGSPARGGWSGGGPGSGGGMPGAGGGGRGMRGGGRGRRGGGGAPAGRASAPSHVGHEQPDA